MRERDGGVVWILGAGFSRPLGGPLLHDLISEPTKNAIQAQVESADIKQELNYALALYSAGRRNRANPGGLWTDPEQAMEMAYVAHARQTGSIAARIAKLQPSVKLRNAPPATKCFKRFVTYACDEFLWETRDDDVTETERWAPFLRWASLLTDEDDVVTFNYDRVLDLLQNKRFGSSPPTTFDSPAFTPRFYERLATRSQATCVPYLHMHGHVRLGAEGNALKLSEGTLDDPVIGTPGRGKMVLTQSHLKEVWEFATRRLGEAKAAVFVGYRFPESDNHAKRVVLGALSRNKATRAHIVLGPESDNDIRRLEGMLRWSGVKEIAVHRMYCQDFFAVFDRAGLVAPIP